MAEVGHDLGTRYTQSISHKKICKRIKMNSQEYKMCCDVYALCTWWMGDSMLMLRPQLVCAYSSDLLLVKSNANHHNISSKEATMMELKRRLFFYRPHSCTAVQYYREFSRSTNWKLHMQLQRCTQVGWWRYFTMNVVSSLMAFWPRRQIP